MSAGVRFNGALRTPMNRQRRAAQNSKDFFWRRGATCRYSRPMTGIKLKDQPLSERPRERLRALGPAAVSPAELIAILLRTGLRGANVLEIGKQVLTKFGSLQALAQASLEELETIKGIGPDKA